MASNKYRLVASFSVLSIFDAPSISFNVYLIETALFDRSLNFYGSFFHK